MRRIFDHLQAMALSNGQQLRHRCRQPGVMHRHDRPGARRDRRFDLRRVDVQGGRIDVDQPDVGTQIAHDFGGRREGVGGGDDLVAGSDAQRLQREVQPRGGRVDGHAMQGPGLAQEGRHVGLKALRLRPGRDPARPQRVDDFGDLLFADLGQRERQERLR